MKRTKITPTRLNLDVLVQTFGVLDRVPNQLPKSRIPHLRRCMEAGLLAPQGRTHLALTPEGRAARADHIAAYPWLLQAANEGDR